MSTGDYVLVTGGAGYVGSHVVLALKAAGWRPVILDDLSTGLRELVPDGTPMIVGDIADRSKLSAILNSYRIRDVVHLAAHTVVPESVADPLRYYRNNTAGSIALIDACIEAGVERFLFSSTAAVYGVPDASPVAETAPTCPINPYGSSKLFTETILRDASMAGDLQCGILRYFNVAGADPHGRTGQCTPEATHLIKQACQVALGLKEQLTVYGDDFDTPDGTGVRDFIHVSDLADAHVQALEWMAWTPENLLVNCGYGRGYSVRQVVQAVERAAKCTLPLCIGPRRAGDPPEVVADNTAIKSLLGWQPRHDSLDWIVETALRWERRLVRPRVVASEFEQTLRAS